MHESPFIVEKQTSRKTRLFSHYNRKDGQKVMVNQIFVEGIVSRRKSGAVELQDIGGTPTAKLTLKSFIEDSGQWETYGVIAEGQLASAIASMNLAIGTPVFVTGSVYQTSHTNPITEETLLYFVINATAMHQLGPAPEKQEPDTSAAKRQPEAKSDIPQASSQPEVSKVRDAKAGELPFPVAE